MAVAERCLLKSAKCFAARGASYRQHPVAELHIAQATHHQTGQWLVIYHHRAYHPPRETSLLNQVHLNQLSCIPDQATKITRPPEKQNSKWIEVEPRSCLKGAPRSSAEYCVKRHRGLIAHATKTS